MHYSFDFAQQLHFPNKPQQPGPAYFLTARKYQLFGVACELTGKQVNYLIDESEEIGKGANVTISLVHHFLKVHSKFKGRLLLHTDNCVGQNKNNAFIHYLMWRVANGKNSSISLSFMIAGHTKFAPDRHFGLIRKTNRRTPVETINCLERFVRNSLTIGCNISQLVRSPSGELLVNYYDWTSYFKDYFKAIPAIAKYHVFCCSHDDPGVIYLRETTQSKEISKSLVKKSLPPQDCFPEQIDTS